MSLKRSKVLVFPFIRDRAGRVQYAVFKKVDTPLGKQGDYWQSIAGGVEEGETLIEAAKREAWEEGGISPDAEFLDLHIKSSYPVGDMVVEQAAFAVRLNSRKITLSEEHSEVRWLSFEEALALLKFEDYKTALKALNARLAVENLDVRTRMRYTISGSIET